MMKKDFENNANNFNWALKPKTIKYDNKNSANAMQGWHDGVDDNELALDLCIY